MLYIIKLPILVKFIQYDKQIYDFRMVSFFQITLFLRYNSQLHGVRPWHDRDYSRCREFVNTINAFKWL